MSANGSIVMIRYRTTGERASSAGSEKKIESARVAAIMASAMALATCVRARRWKGVTVNAPPPQALLGGGPWWRGSLTRPW
ncbi:MAG: hypothetical protein U0P45_08585 [Acidimicrobiales bacterium]